MVPDVVGSAHFTNTAEREFVLQCGSSDSESNCALPNDDMVIVVIERLPLHRSVAPKSPQ